MKEKDLFGLSFCSLFGAWKIVGMTMTCNRCDVMTVHMTGDAWCAYNMTQQSLGAG